MHARRTMVVGTLVVALLGGCGLFSGDEPEPTGGSSTSSGGEETEPQGPTPEELSAQVLDAAAAEGDAEPIGSATGAGAGGEQLTVEVLAVERTDGATLVTMRLSGEDNSFTPADLDDGRFGSTHAARTLVLVDAAVSASRYLPLQFEDYRTVCTCPQFPLKVGPEAQTVTAMFPPLPDGVQTVDLVANDFLTVPGLPVTG